MGSHSPEKRAVSGRNDDEGTMEGEEDGIQMQALVLKCIWNICNVHKWRCVMPRRGGRQHDIDAGFCSAIANS